MNWTTPGMAVVAGLETCAPEIGSAAVIIACGLVTLVRIILESAIPMLTVLPPMTGGIEESHADGEERRLV